MNNYSLGFVGLGKLGLPMASCLAENNAVCGVDCNVGIQRDLAGIIEPGVKVDQVHIVGTSVADLPESLDAIIILVNTPEVDGKFSLEQIESVLSVMSQSQRDSLIILSSTVSPGSCEYLVNKYNLPRFAYIPDFVALGTVVHDFQYPEVFIVGAASLDTASDAASIISSMHKNNCPRHYLSLQDAEYAKVLLNNYIAMKISFANLIDQLTTDSKAVAVALGCDTRIGAKYLRPGLPWGGQCFPRDVTVMKGLYAPLAQVVEGINERQYNKILDYVVSHASGKILVLGLGFKPGTNCQDHSFGPWLVDQLNGKGFIAEGWDKLSGTPLDTSFDTFIITQDDPELRNLVRGATQNQNILDLWRI